MTSGEVKSPVRQHGRTPFEGRQCRTAPHVTFPAASRCLDRCPGRGAQGGRDTADSRRRRVRSPVTRTGSGSEPGRAHLAVRAGAVVIGSALLPLDGAPGRSIPGRFLLVPGAGRQPRRRAGRLLSSRHRADRAPRPGAPGQQLHRVATGRTRRRALCSAACGFPRRPRDRARYRCVCTGSGRRAGSALRCRAAGQPVAGRSRCGGLRRFGVRQSCRPWVHPRARALLAVRQASRSAGHAGVDGVALAGGLLAADSGRSRHVVLISTGTDDASKSDIAQVLTTLDARGISLHPVSVRGSLGPSWGGQCPPTVRAGQEAAASSLLASRVAETYELVVPRADPSAPMTGSRPQRPGRRQRAARRPSPAGDRRPWDEDRGDRAGRVQAGTEPLDPRRAARRRPGPGSRPVPALAEPAQVARPDLDRAGSRTPTRSCSHRGRRAGGRHRFRLIIGAIDGAELRASPNRPSVVCRSHGRPLAGAPDEPAGTPRHRQSGGVRGDGTAIRTGSLRGHPAAVRAVHGSAAAA